MLPLIALLLLVTTHIAGTMPVATGETEGSQLYLNASVDSTLTLSIYVKNNVDLDAQSRVTGFTIYFTRNSKLGVEKYKKWQQIELLAAQEDYNFRLNGNEYHIRQDTVYRILATVFINHVEGPPSEVIVLNTRDAAPRAPVIQSTHVLINSSVVIQFVPGEDVPSVTNYTLEYRDVTFSTESLWSQVEFESDSASRVLLSGLYPNRTYAARLFVTGHGIRGIVSKQVFFDTNNTAELAVLSVEPSTEILFDPDISAPLQAKCTAVSKPASTIQWMVNGVPVNVDHAFYTILATVDDIHTVSTIRARSRTRSDNLTCVASNPAGEVRADVRVSIRGPGSPPSAITLTAERGGYTISWLPPSHPNGQIKKYVVYHSLNKDEPLSDWQKLDLDGSERSVKVISSSTEAFYVRVQAATGQGPGIISDLVAIERDTLPIAVFLNLTQQREEEEGEFIVNPAENVTVSCTAVGKPRPNLHFALSDLTDPLKIMHDVWQPLRWRPLGDAVTSSIDIALVSSRTLHCRARNSAGANYTSMPLRVKKPGDAPRNVQVLSIDSRDVVVVWETPTHPNRPLKMYHVILMDPAAVNQEPAVYEVSQREGALLTRVSLPSDQLKPSHSYSVSVRAVNDAGHGPTSTPVEFMTLNGGPEVPPSGVSVDIDEANTAILRWTSPNCTTSVESYIVYYTRDLGIPDEDYLNWQTATIPGNANRWKLDYHLGFRPKTLYRLRLAAANDVASGPVSKTVEFETSQSILPIPTDLEVTVDEDNTVHITYAAVRDPDDHSMAIQSYILEVAETQSIVTAEWTTIQPSYSHVDEVTLKGEMSIDGSRLSPNRMYWVRVTADLDNPTRLVQSSKPVHFRTGHGKLRTRVSIAEGSELRVEPNLFGSLLMTCHGEGSPAPNLSWYWNDDVINTTDEHWTIVEERTMRKSVSYLKRSSVVESGLAVCEASNSEGSDTAQLDVIVLGPGSAPAAISVEPHRNHINISWEPPVLPNGNITKYLVYTTTREMDDLGDWDKLEMSGSELNISISSQGAELSHAVRLQAVSDMGPGIISEIVTCISDLYYAPLEVDVSAMHLIDDIAEPGKPIELRCHGKGDPTPSLFYNWEGEDKTVVSGANFDLDPDTKEFSGGFQLETFVTKTVVCMAVNKYETRTANRTITVRKPADVPENIRWSFDEDGRLFIDWEEVKYPNGNASYHIYLSHSDVIVPGPPVRWAKNEIPLNMNLSLQIAAVNEWLEGERSREVTVTTPNGGPQDWPIISSVDVVNTTVCMEWTAPLKPLGEIKEYSIYFEQEDEEVSDWQIVQVPGNVNEFCLNGNQRIRMETRYKLKVSASNDVNEGPSSPLSFFDTITVNMEAPLNVTAVLRNTSLVVFIPAEHVYENFIIYVRKSTSEHYWKYEALNVSQSQQTITVSDFPLDRTASYRMKVSGIVNGRETEQSEEFDLTVEQAPTPPSEENGADKRRILKEPPL